jgi:hypothetical protein
LLLLSRFAFLTKEFGGRVKASLKNGLLFQLGEVGQKHVIGQVPLAYVPFLPRVLVVSIGVSLKHTGLGSVDAGAGGMMRFD